MRQRAGRAVEGSPIAQLALQPHSNHQICLGKCSDAIGKWQASGKIISVYAKFSINLIQQFFRHIHNAPGRNRHSLARRWLPLLPSILVEMLCITIVAIAKVVPPTRVELEEGGKSGSVAEVEGIEVRRGRE